MPNLEHIKNLSYFEREQLALGQLDRIDADAERNREKAEHYRELARKQFSEGHPYTQKVTEVVRNIITSTYVFQHRARGALASSLGLEEYSLLQSHAMGPVEQRPERFIRTLSPAIKYTGEG